MKKKFLSLLLAVALIVTTVSLGFAGIVANAFGAEDIATFRLEDTKTYSYGANYTTTIKIKNVISGYKVVVRSITATLPNLQKTANVTYTPGTEVTSEWTFNVSGSLAAGQADVIRYTCNYDIYTTAGALVYADLTGYGYGFASHSAPATGTVGTELPRPGRNDSSHNITGWVPMYSAYVNTYPASSTFSLKTDTWHGSQQYRAQHSAGNLPPTVTLSTTNFPSTSSSSKSKTNTETWWTMSAPVSNFYNFTISFPDSDNGSTLTMSIYYMNGNDAVSANNAVANSLATCKQKKYYTAASWNNYLAKLDAAAYAGRATPGATESFKTACQTVVSSQSALQTAYNGLVEGPGDYSAFNSAVSAFNAKANATTAVTTYNPNGPTGSTTMHVYNQTTAQSGRDYINACSMSLKAGQQGTIDAYTAEINSRANTLPANDANYTHLDAAIADMANYTAEAYSADSWSNYHNAIISANQVSRGLNSLSQATVNTTVAQVTAARMALVFLPANTTELMAQIAIAGQIIQEQPQGVPDELWNEFQAAYNAALALQNADVTQQAAVDTAAERLETANKSLAEYREIDVSPLLPYLDINNPTPNYDYVPRYSADKYEADSYSIWQSAYNDGVAFNDAYNQGLKNHSHFDAMMRIIERLQGGLSGLVKIKADYTALFATLETVPDVEELSLYVDMVYNNILSIISGIDYDIKFDAQAEVDAINANLQNALSQLTYENYKPADYTIVNNAIAQANALNPSFYNNFEIVTAAISTVDSSKKIVEQEDVNAMAANILSAISNLDEKSADYTVVTDALARIDDVEYLPEYPHYYYNYADLQDAIDDIDYDKKISQQSDVNAMADRINTAIDNLGLADADYTPVEQAIESISTLGNLDDFTDDSLNDLDDAVSASIAAYNYKINDQHIVDAFAQDILDKIDAMVLLPADFSRMDDAFLLVGSINRDNCVSLLDLDAAINAAQDMYGNRNIRQQAEVDAAVQAIIDAKDALVLKPADFDALDAEIANAENLIATAPYPFTQDSIDAVEAVIVICRLPETRAKDITQQDEIYALLADLQDKVFALVYIPADYSEVDLAVALAQQKLEQEELYTPESVYALREALTAINMSYRADNQPAVDAMAVNVNNKIAALVYSPADYQAVNDAIDEYNTLIREYYFAEDLAEVDAAVAAVVSGYTKERQAQVDAMATNITTALTALYPKIKLADTTALDNAVALAIEKREFMLSQHEHLDPVTLEPLSAYLYDALAYHNAPINLQGEINTLTQNIIEATANLKFLFKLLDDTTAIINDEANVIYGFAEGTTGAQALAMFSYIGNGSIVLEAEPYGNGFGTGSVIKFLDGSGEVIKEYEVVIFGDVDGDGYVDLFDAGYVVSIANMEAELTGSILMAADINKDGVIDAYDVSYMISLANMETEISQTGDNAITPIY